MANDRLKELLRQRALLEEHLDWLESEINAAQSESVEVPATAESQQAAIPANRLSEHLVPDQTMEALPLLKQASEGDPENAHVVSDLYDELGPETHVSVNQARRDLIILFALGFAGLATIAIWVWWKY